MFLSWLRHLLWRPFEFMCRNNPIISLQCLAEEPHPGIVCLKFSNFIIRFLSWFAGGYDYAAIYVVDNTLVFDTGFAWSRKALTAHLMSSGVRDTIKYVINSHGHEDHIGNNDVFEELCGCQIHAHGHALRSVNYVENKEWYRHFLFGSYEPVEVTENQPSYRTDSFEWKALHTPGHTPDHICLFEPHKKILLSGDLFLDENISSQLSDVNGPDWIESLEMILTLNVELLLDGHGLFIRGLETVREALECKLAFLRLIRDKTLEISKTEKNIQRITRRVFDDESLTNLVSMNEGWMAFITAGSFSRSNVVKSFLQ